MLGTGALLEVGRVVGKWRATRAACHSVDVGLFVQRAHLQGWHASKKKIKRLCSGSVGRVL